MYVIHRRWNVINPRERNIQVLRLDDIPFALQTDYIRLTAITYQSFGLDKNKALVSASALFFVYGLQKRYFCRFSVWLRTLTFFSEVSAAPSDVVLSHSDVLLLRRKVMWCVPPPHARSAHHLRSKHHARGAHHVPLAEHIVEKRPTHKWVGLFSGADDRTWTCTGVTART